MKNFCYNSLCKYKPKYSIMSHSLSLIASPERVRSNIFRSDRINKQLQSFTSSLKTTIIEENDAFFSSNPMTDFNKLILTCDAKMLTTLSPTRKYVNKSNTINHINFQRTKNKYNPFYLGFYENERKNSFENFVKGLQLGRYKNLYK